MLAVGRGGGSISDIFKKPGFNLLFSFLLGFGLVCLARPLCKGRECVIEKAPKRKEFEEGVYKIDGKCYKFSSEMKTCPATDVIEPFRVTYRV